MPTTTHLHYGGEAIELPKDCNIEILVEEVQKRSAPGTVPSWLPVSDKDHNQHRILITPGVSVRVSTTNTPEPSAPVGIGVAGTNINDLRF
jgi:hypothetical protein